MKKNLFAIVVVLAGALSISPLSIALENSGKQEKLPEYMYASNQNTEVDASVTEAPEKEDSNVKTDSDIADKIVVKDDTDVVNVSDNKTEVQHNDKLNAQVQKGNRNVERKVQNVSNNKPQRRRAEVRNRNQVRNRNEVRNNVQNVERRNRVEQVVENRNDQTQQNVQNTEQQKALSREEALQVLKEKNKNCDFDYMGDENTFNVLKEKGQEGYVFLPEAQTDLGLFVNKNTREVYTFHPSGSLDIY